MPSDKTSNDNPLASLSPEQLEALLDALRPKPAASLVALTDDELARTVLPRPTTLNNVFWKVTDGYFETVVDGRDALSAEIAFDKAQDPLQPWYFHGHHGELVGSSVAITRKEYIEWLKK